MDQRTLIVSCIEYYSYLKNIPANKVFSSFHRNAILPLILESHEQFPEMGVGFYMGMIDGLIALESDAQADDYLHFEERTALGLEVVAMLAKRHRMNDREACEMYYHSKTAESVSEDKTGYYLKSAKEIFELIEAE
ncbi:MAG: hypothetical protein IKI88_05840 [Anaerotignum sp.]|nr:hypothetical protein [Anaerotignum sp.]